jgi:hypothetical protein
LEEKLHDEGGADAARGDDGRDHESHDEWLDVVLELSAPAVRAEEHGVARALAAQGNRLDDLLVKLSHEVPVVALC